uniref:Reverse transcriptase domain-containing protein n=1 Tax=Scylla olivacea TaxID=85551 RepID=A0A0N7ZDM8_SCYOL
MELQNALKSGGDTSPGENGITHSMTRGVVQEGHAALLQLFNTSLREGKLSSRWKEATIVPIPKPKDTGTYHPISLLSCVCKTMEILHRLQWITGPLLSSIHTYKKGTVATECLVSLLTAAGQGKCTAVFLDLEKAFELAHETVILARLAEKGVEGHLLEL